MCGRGGIGRRAALRSLWGKLRGSSSLLDRTNISLEYESKNSLISFILKKVYLI